MQLVCDKSTALVSKMRVGTNSEIDLLDNVDFSAIDNDNNKNSHILPTGQWYAPSAVNYSAYPAYSAKSA